jgi:CHAT domain-containing protein/Tfp pilus assembly protein PilF
MSRGRFSPCPWGWLAGLLGGAALFLVCATPVLLHAAPAAPDETPQQYVEQGLQQFQRGDFGPAVLSWTAAARLYEQQGKAAEHSTVLTHLAQAYQAIGQYRLALQSLQAALPLAEQSGDQAHIASVLGSLGNVYIVTDPPEKAAQYLHQGLEIARDIGETSLAAVILNNLGNLLTFQQRYDEALAAYSESRKLAQENALDVLAARALTNAATASIQRGQHAESKALLDEALNQMRALEPSHDKVYGLLNVALAYDELRASLPSAHDALLLRAAEILNEVAALAGRLDDARAISYAWGYLGKLYEEERRYPEALQLTRRAVLAAQRVHAPEALYRWQWQTGRLLRALGEIDTAMAAYRRAVDTLQSIRPEMALGYGRLPSFRTSLGPLYFELVDLLLQRAASETARVHYEPYLREARDIVELFKVAELQDYFQDDCVDMARAKATKLDIVSQTAIVVYPILLPDRTELLVSLPAGLERFTVPVGSETLTQEVRAFRRKLEKRTTREFLPHAQQLYDWLIRPFEPALAALTLETLVFVPDGPLRTIPMAALHDGQQFLITKYALAITPSLDLTDPQPLKRDQARTLALGLTEAVQGFPALPNVSAELQAIQKLQASDVLLNKEFLVSRVEKGLQSQQPTIVHVASHGQFESDVRKTFILTFDDKLTMDRLDQFVGFFRFRDDPLELLTLSACQTAAGDDRAALGLAGVAIKAGARSALATLWYINDQASSDLVAEFYRQLQDPAVSRALALQRAQLKLLNDPRYQHPGYWSPFLLINNWL